MSISGYDHIHSHENTTMDTRDQYPGMSYKSFWGDEYSWTSLLPLAWKTWNLEGRLKPKVGDPMSAFSWWSVPLHLLGLGMGWNNLALGLQQWRQMGYPEEHQLLKFLARSYGKSLEALEVWLVQNQDIIDEFQRELQLHGFKGAHVDENLRPEQYEDQGLTPDRNFIDQAKRRYDFGPRWQMATHLFGGGYDSLHLAMHFLNSAPFDGTEGHDEEELDEIKVLFMTESRIGIQAPAYKGFPYRLIEAIGLHGQIYKQDPPVVSLFIRSLGHIGDFQHSLKTGRFFLVSEKLDLARQESFHLLGSRV